jgi:hypothetical protein
LFRKLLALLQDADKLVDVAPVKSRQKRMNSAAGSGAQGQFGLQLCHRGRMLGLAPITRLLRLLPLFTWIKKPDESILERWLERS